MPLIPLEPVPDATSVSILLKRIRDVIFASARGRYASKAPPNSIRRGFDSLYGGLICKFFFRSTDFIARNAAEAGLTRPEFSVPDLQW